MPQFNQQYREAMDELFANLEPHELPKIIHTRLGIAMEKPIKLFCLVGEPHPASNWPIGAPRVEPGLYASDLLVELVAATRTLDWEKIGVLLEQAISPAPST
jgi:hypothetical protein